MEFQSDDQNLKCIVLCKQEDTFNVVVNKIYETNPGFKEYSNYFICNGNKINEYFTLSANKIKDRDVVVLNRFDDDF